MNDETLERLMLDRGLGALPPDCEELLSSYLETHPVSAAINDEIEQTIRATRRVLATNTSTSLPAFPRDRLARTSQRKRNLSVLRNGIALAASLLLGIGMHAFWFAKSSPDSPTPPAYFVANIETSPNTTAPVPSDGNFWSSRRLFNRAAGTTPQSQPKVIWRSPTAWPRIGDAT